MCLGNQRWGKRESLLKNMSRLVQSQTLRRDYINFALFKNIFTHESDVMRQ